MVGDGIGRELLRKTQRALVNRYATVGADDPMQVRKVSAAVQSFLSSIWHIGQTL